MSPEKLSAQTMDLKESLTKFKAAFWEGSLGGSSSVTTWKAAYLPYLRRLELADEQEITTDLLITILKSYAPSSRSRQQCGQVLGRLARSTNIELPDNWDELAGGYETPARGSRPVIADSQIIEGFHKIPNKQWRTAYGLVATYGLRNYEVFFCDFSQMSPENYYVLKVLDVGSNRQRDVYPLHFNWVKEFQLAVLSETTSCLPFVSANPGSRSPQQIGRRLAEQLRRYRVGITASDLRHAWALRAIHEWIPDSITSKMMGIDLARFFVEYSDWIENRDMEYMQSGAWSELA